MNSRLNWLCSNDSEKTDEEIMDRLYNRLPDMGSLAGKECSDLYRTLELTQELWLRGISKQQFLEYTAKNFGTKCPTCEK
jgi:hypothetical protein